MRPRVIFIVCAVLASLFGVSAIAGGPRTETKTYINGPAYLCGMSQVCFHLDGTASSVDVVVSDEIQENVGVWYYCNNNFSGPGTNLGSGVFCGSQIAIPIPDDATRFYVTVTDHGLIPLENRCKPRFGAEGVSDEGIIGTVTATFR